jgi:transposase InsO family protein/predicted aspartyl protease
VKTTRKRAREKHKSAKVMTAPLHAAENKVSNMSSLVGLCSANESDLERRKKPRLSAKRRRSARAKLTKVNGLPNAGGHVCAPLAPLGLSPLTVGRKELAQAEGAPIVCTQVTRTSWKETRQASDVGMESGRGALQVSEASVAAVNGPTYPSSQVKNSQTGGSGGEEGNVRTEREKVTIAAVSGVEQDSIYIQGSIDGCQTKFLVDTGAGLSVIGRGVLERLPRAKQLAFRTRSRNLWMADGKLTTAPGPVLCEVEVHGRTILEPFCVLPEMEDAILGMPALHSLGCDITVAGRKVFTAETRADIRRVRPERIARIKIVEDVEIPARSERVVSGEVDSWVKGDTVMVTPESNAGSFSDNLLVARSISEVTVGRVSVRLCNTSERPVTIKANQRVAEACSVEVVEGTGEKLNEDSDEVPEHLTEVYSAACERGDLTEETRKRLRALLARYGTLFAKHDNDLGRTNLIQHDIHTGDAPPIRQPPRRVPYGMLAEYDAEMERLLKSGAASPGQSPWASPVVLVRKKDGSVRFCVDYRRLNAVTTFDAYPLPRIDETLEALGGARLFSTLDLISGYWQVGLTEEARKKAAFTTRNGLFLWNVMPFGLCNAPGTFERLMEAVLRGLQWKECLVYLDDVVVFAKSEEEMLERLDSVFGRLLAAGLKLKPRKCALFAKETEYLGHIVSESGIHVNPSKVEAVRSWPTPQTKTEVRSFLGTASYYRRFVPEFATVAAPLHAVASPKTAWVWTEECQRAFDELKSALIQAPVLSFPVPDAPYILDTDASLTGIGAVLSQVIDGEERVLGYFSEALDPAERNYCVTRRELLAVVKALRHYHCYLYRRKFTIRTDHSSLRWLLNFRDPKDQLARWMDELSVYANQYEIEHRPGVKHGNADGLSRIPCRQCKRDDCQSAVEPPAVRIRAIQLESRWTEAEMALAQEQDPEIRPVLDAVKKGQMPTKKERFTWPPAAKRYLRDFTRLKVRNGVLWREWVNGSGVVTSNQFITPRSMRAEVLQQAHDHRLAGHFGEARTLDRIRTQFRWTGMTDDVDHWLRSCEICASRRAPPKRAHHSLERQVVQEPNERVAIDILGPFEPAADSGNLHILVMTDYLTKWVEAVPMPGKTAEQCANAFVEGWILRLGPPRQLLTDKGMQFEAAMFQEMCRLLDIEKLRTTAYHPQCDGQTERMNKTLLDLLNKLPVDRPRNWDLRLPYALACYRSSVHSVTKFTPNRLMLGREVTTPLTMLLPRPPRAPDLVPYCQQLKQRFEESHQLAVVMTQQSHKAAQAYHDGRSLMFDFKEGQKVWLYDPKPHKGISRKLARDVWSGWWCITKCLNTSNYVIKYMDGKQTQVVSADRLFPYVERATDRFTTPTAPALSDDDVSSEDEEADVLEATDPPEQSRGEIEEVLEQRGQAGATSTSRPTRQRRPPPRWGDYVLREEMEAVVRRMNEEPPRTETVVDASRQLLQPECKT